MEVNEMLVKGKSKKVLASIDKYISAYILNRRAEPLRIVIFSCDFSELLRNQGNPETMTRKQIPIVSMSNA